MHFVIPVDVGKKKPRNGRIFGHMMKMDTRTALGALVCSVHRNISQFVSAKSVGTGNILKMHGHSHGWKA